MTLSETTSFTDQEHALEHLESLIDQGEDRSEMEAFIEEHGHKDFYLYFEDYRQAVHEFDQETVDSFLEVFDLMDIAHLGDAYMGYHESGAAFAESFVTDMGYIQNDMPYWIAIDWEETWDNLSYDYSESNGYIWNNHW